MDRQELLLQQMHKSFFYLLLPLTLGLTSCGDDPVSDNEPTDLTTNVNANDTTGDQSKGRWEMPKLQSSYDYITHYLTEGSLNGQLNYAMEYCPEKYHAHWVAYRYDTSLAKSATSRSDEWGAEPYYNNNKKYQIAAGQMFNGYNRGHIVGSAERLCSHEANVQTFYMSNMSPMNGNFNSIYWGAIEDKVRDNWGRKVSAGDTLYVVKGGTIDDNHIRSNRVTVHNTLGQEVQVVVPSYYFIACLMRSANGDCKAIGFYMEHKDYKNQSDEYLKQLCQESACTIDDLEQKTGIDFFCNVPDKVENYVESAYNLSSWNGLK